MTYSITLQNKNSLIELPLHEVKNEFKQQIIRETIYQNIQYELIIKNNDDTKKIKDIQLFINEECINERFNNNVYLENNIYRFPYEYIFSTIFGFVNISIEATLEDDSIEYYTTDYISAAVDENDNKEALLSLKNMVKYIYDNNIELLYASNSNRVSKLLLDTEKSNNRTMETEINLLNEILTCYNDNLKYFMDDLKSKTVSHNEINDIKKLRKIDANTIKYIVSHPEQLKETNHITGIRYNLQNYEPVKTLISNNYNNYNIYENQVVLGFVKYLIDQLIVKIQNLEKILQDHQINFNIRNSLEKGYISSSEIVYKYSRITMVEYSKKLKNIKDGLQYIYYNYKNTMRCEEIPIDVVPKPTDVFMYIKHYRSIFIEISKWFEYGNYNMEKNQQMLSFLTADDIYEYYCLLNIIAALKKFGFKENIALRIPYKYEVNDKRFKNTTICNTFYFSNGEKEVTLYYQPVIYSYNNQKRNRITLFRTDGKQKIFTPDFLIKIKENEKTKYAILDSKWSKYNTIKNYRYNETAWKYLYLIRDERNFKNVDFMWLLQGRNDKNNITYFNDGKISGEIGSQIKESSGIMKMIPEVGNKYFEKIFKSMLNIDDNVLR